MEEIMPLLEKLAQSLGTTAENLWRVLLQQVAVEKQLCMLWMNIALWGGGILLGLFVIAFFLGMIWNDKSIEKKSKGWAAGMWSSADEWIGVSAFGFIGFIVVLIIAGLTYYSNYSTLLTLNNNPEYWALEQILKTIGK